MRDPVDRSVWALVLIGVWVALTPLVVVVAAVTVWEWVT